MTRILRVEHPEGYGLWYDRSGAFTAHMPTNTPECQAGALPMDWNETFHENGNWYSAVIDLDMLFSWFSEHDLKELLKLGYKVYEFEVEEYRIESGHPIFKREEYVGREMTTDEIGL